MLSRWWRDALSLLFPSVCCACDEPLVEADESEVEGESGAPWLCRGCFSLLREPPGPRCRWCAARVAAWDDPAAAPCARCRRRPPFEQVRVWAAHRGVARKLVVATKYGGLAAAARPLGERLAVLATAAPAIHADLVVPVPMHWRTRRAFNHAELLAEPVARTLGVPLAPRALRRRGGAVRQAALGGEERERNVADAFRCRRPKRVAGRRVVLVDDVFTTGATAAACTRALLEGGATAVSVLAATRADSLAAPHVAAPQAVA
ncbi:MAG: ComF family protein [Planctomycetota bacterium]